MRLSDVESPPAARLNTNRARTRSERNNRQHRRVRSGMTTAHPSPTKFTATLPSTLFRMPEFDTVTNQRTVGDILRDSLEDAEAQLRLERRRARRAERRAQDLARAVSNWHELIEEYERSTSDHRRN